MSSELLAVISSIGIAAGGVIMFAWSMVTGARARSTQSRVGMERAQNNLMEIVQGEAKAWKARYESEHAEFLEYRQKTHDQAQIANATVLKLTSENADLKAKTDLTPVLKFHQDQTEINSKIVQTLDRILTHLALPPQLHDA